jgi:hypothetical protein
VITKIRLSQKASFLGDSDFPRSAEDFVKGKKIKLVQSLYERYSNMELTFSWDRPNAIRGLEARLMKTFGGTCVYGILRPYFHRCLLWKKKGNSMKPISPSPGKKIPSWSFMAYEGAIEYIDPPGSKVEWMKDLVWPPSEPKTEAIDNHGLNRQIKNDDRSLLEIEAPIWDLVEPRVEDMTLDTDTPFDAHQSKCVIVGVSNQSTESERAYYVLIVQLFLVGNKEVWKRRGLAVMEPRYIALNGPKMIVSIK